MQINRKSWHYRLIKFFNSGRVPNNLCEYMQWLILSAFIWVVACMAACAFALALGYSMFWVPIQWVLGLFDPTIVVTDMSVLYCGLFLWCFITVCSVWLYGAVSGWFERKTPRKPSLIAEYIRAKHQKICKRINFV